jgi:hypothetical protein
MRRGSSPGEPAAAVATGPAAQAIGPAPSPRPAVGKAKVDCCIRPILEEKPDQGRVTPPSMQIETIQAHDFSPSLDELA